MISQALATSPRPTLLYDLPTSLAQFCSQCWKHNRKVPSLRPSVPNGEHSSGVRRWAVTLCWDRGFDH